MLWLAAMGLDDHQTSGWVTIVKLGCVQSGHGGFYLHGQALCMTALVNNTADFHVRHSMTFIL